MIFDLAVPLICMADCRPEPAMGEEIFSSPTAFILPHADLVPITDDGLVSVTGLVITWSIPASTMQFRRTYRLTITDRSGNTVHDVMTNDTRFDASSLMLSSGTYSVKVSTEAVRDCQARQAAGCMNPALVLA